jgi:predicted phage terminase large subunit-like protein
MIAAPEFIAIPDDLLAEATSEELLLYERYLKTWYPLPHQIAPEGDDWRLWMLLAGRGTGKTDAGANYIDTYAKTHPNTRIRIIAPTLGDAREACVVGVSGILAHDRAVTFNANEGVLHWPNGSRARIFGASTPEDVERLRAGGNSHLDWWEELAAWRKLDECLDQARFGLRLGHRWHAVATTTPKPIKALVKLVKDPRTRVSTASTDDNPYLEASLRADLYERYAGTRLGRQELMGEILEDIEGALWNVAQLGALKVVKPPQKRWYDELANDWAYADDLVRVAVGVDPASTSGPDSDETGIIVAAKGADGRGYVLADRTCRATPADWGRRVIQACLDYKADCVVLETNQGGEMAEQVILTAARAMGLSVRVKKVHAAQSKRLRAEPIAALYEQGKVSHALGLEKLEDEMTSYTVDSGFSPDRLDSLVHVLTELMLKKHATLSFHGAT